MSTFSTANPIRTKKKYSWKILRAWRLVQQNSNNLLPQRNLMLNRFDTRKHLQNIWDSITFFLTACCLGRTQADRSAVSIHQQISQLSTKRHVVVRRLRSVYYHVARLQWSKLKQFEPNKNPWNIFPKDWTSQRSCCWDRFQRIMKRHTAQLPPEVWIGATPLVEAGLFFKISHEIRWTCFCIGGHMHKCWCPPTVTSMYFKWFCMYVCGHTNIQPYIHTYLHTCTHIYTRMHTDIQT